jgi:hypothetical protein
MGTTVKKAPATAQVAKEGSAVAAPKTPKVSAKAKILGILKGLDPKSTVADAIKHLESLKAVGGARESGIAIKNAKGETVAILDFYSKRWCPLVGPKAVEFSPKANSLGFNSMSKVSTNLWTKRNSEIKKRTASMTSGIASGKLAGPDIAKEAQAIEKLKDQIDASVNSIGFGTKEEVEKYLATVK